jgi:nicotinate-nucleotide--dimethylbenzimidazole phosphoribosyltransferase
MSLLDETLAAIRPPDGDASDAALAQLNSLTKPPGSLGRLEEIVRRYAAIRADRSARWGRGAIAVFVADHGVADEGVSAYPKAVTVQMLRNIATGGAAISVLARHFGFELQVVDVGVEQDTSADPMPGVIYRRVGAGTRSMLRDPAMSPDETRRALEVGIEIARDAAQAGATLLGIGEMGIANSTSAAALLCATAGIPPARIAGRGTGLDENQFRHKVDVIERSLTLHAAARRDPLARLAALGGFEIAAMAGACLGAAANRVPVVVDGFIATSAAAIASELHPALRDYLFFAHRSAEGGHALALEYLQARPILDLEMRLGEGTGAALAMSTIRAALELFHNMATFAGAGVAEKLK